MASQIEDEVFSLPKPCTYRSKCYDVHPTANGCRGSSTDRLSETSEPTSMIAAIGDDCHQPCSFCRRINNRTFMCSDCRWQADGGTTSHPIPSLPRGQGQGWLVTA
ncbi:hypothetical protein VTK26DRAFT_8419 [Humicola hyalothermophila]